MAKLENIKIEIEITMFKIVKTHKKWWQFWKNKTHRVIVNNEEEFLK